MKKFVVLMLVLGIACTASARLTWTDAPGGDIDTITLTSMSDTATVYIYSDAALTGSFSAYPEMAGAGSGWYVAEIVAATPLPAAGESAGVFYGPTYGYMGADAKDANPDNNPVGNVTVGLWYEVIIHATSPLVPGGASTIIDLDHFAQMGPTDYLLVNHIPEPATIALLGLGGLLLRRKKA